MTLDLHTAAGMLLIAIGALAIMHGIRGVTHGLGTDLSDAPDNNLHPVSGSQRTMGFLWDLALHGLGVPCGLWLMYRGVAILFE